MNQERFRQIEELYHAAREGTAEQRAVLLAQSDPELRREVELLLARGPGDEFLDRPAIQNAPELLEDPTVTQLAEGVCLGPYRIESKLGEGGMGKVFRALDARLGRAVAIKTTQQRFSARFEREARAIASLNHPNICQIYDVGANYLVMELVEGPTLAGKIKAGGLQEEEALAITRQMGEALEAAHERGIIHRDLKPANIKIRPDGTVKLLDFGLAKIAEESAPAAQPAAAPEGPTFVGQIMGTPAYMAPEQARGQAVDKRADIWAFGVVLYEMLTGRRLFQGETVTDTIAAVVTREPDWSALPAGTPANVRRLLDRCLRKDVKTRLRDIGEALVLLDEPEASAPAASALRARLAWMLAAAFALSTLALVVLRPRPKLSDPGPAIARFQISLVDGTTWPTNNNATQWAPSPDGSNLAMIAADLSTGKNALWVRPLGSASEHRLDKTEGANFPFWAPDGHSIGFFAENKLKRVALSGGSVQTVCEVASGADGGSWGQDGTILFAAVNGPLMRVSATGGIPRPASLLAEGETWHSWPQFLPGGRHVLCLAENKDAANNAIYVQELDSTKRVRVLNNLTRAVWSPPGYLLFVREGTLFAQRMDAKTFQVEGEARAVAQDVATNDANGRSSFAVSENGVLAYRHGAAVEMKQLTWRGHDGKAIGKVGAPGKILNPTLSPDGKNVAVLMGDVEADMDAWVLNLANGVPARLTRDAKAWLVYDVMVWSPDSQRLAISQGNGVIKVITLASEEIVPLTKENARAWDWSPDGRSILCTDIPRPRRVRLLSLTEEAKLPAIPDPPYNQTQYRFSPDGQYVVYASNESGQQEIYVASFPSFAIKRKISSGGAMFPVWPKGGGKEIFYRSNDGWMMSAEIHTGANIEASIPKPLFRFGRGRPTLNRFAVSADSGRFLIAEAVQDSDAEKLEITLVLNWAAEVKLQ